MQGLHRAAALRSGIWFTHGCSLWKNPSSKGILYTRILLVPLVRGIRPPMMGICGAIDMKVTNNQKGTQTTSRVDGKVTAWSNLPDGGWEGP